MKKSIKWVAVILSILFVAGAVFSAVNMWSYIRLRDTEAFCKVFERAAANRMSITEWPPEIIELLNKNAETEDYVLSYPFLKESLPAENIDDYEGGVPLLMQWDKRWGYENYSGTVLGLSGCGPTCLSMVALYLLGDTSLTPAYIARFAEDNGFSSLGNGSKWTLMSEGGAMLGMKVTELPLVESRIIEHLKKGEPIICAMGEGAFTSDGHFIVLTGYKDGLVTLNDPNSRQNSQRGWSFSEFSNQIRNLWVCRK